MQCESWDKTIKVLNVVCAYVAYCVRAQVVYECSSRVRNVYKHCWCLRQDYWRGLNLNVIHTYETSYCTWTLCRYDVMIWLRSSGGPEPVRGDGDALLHLDSKLNPGSLTSHVHWAPLSYILYTAPTTTPYSIAYELLTLSTHIFTYKTGIFYYFVAKFSGKSFYCNIKWMFPLIKLVYSFSVRYGTVVTKILNNSNFNNLDNKSIDVCTCYIVTVCLKEQTFGILSDWDNRIKVLR